MSGQVSYPPYHKFTTEEALELVRLFRLPERAVEEISGILRRQTAPPAATLFRYYNDQSRTERFEKEFAAKLGSKFALGVNSGTSALIAAMVAAGVGPGEEVIVPGYTFFASVSAIVVAKGIPVITEIDESLTLDPQAVEKNITKRTRAILVVHMVGHPAKMDALRRIADRHKLVLLEDVAQATGGAYHGRSLGSWGHLGCFSFDAYKVLGTGEGGMVTTDDEWLYTRAQSYHDTAACWRPNRYARERAAGELFCGENYRMSEMSAAIGLAQLAKLDWVNSNTRRCYNQFRNEVQLPAGARWIEPADPEGLCGYMVGVIFETRELAERVVKAEIGLGGLASGGTQGARDWHVYWHWDHIMEQKTATAEGCPFRCPHVKSPPKYSPEMCPKTKDIMLRTGFFKFEPTMTREYVSFCAEKMTGDLRRIVAR